MADYCVQCAKELGFEGTDFTKRAPVPKGMGYAEICEGCGFVYVDGDGRCLGGINCIRQH